MRNRKSNASPGGSPRPACDYSKRERGDGRGRPMNRKQFNPISVEGFGLDVEIKADLSTLAGRFVIPPFSVLSARDGEWQKRKRAWISLGIESELGRGEGITWGDSEEITEKGLNYYRNKNKKLRERVASFKNQDKLVAFQKNKKRERE